MPGEQWACRGRYSDRPHCLSVGVGVLWTLVSHLGWFTGLEGASGARLPWIVRPGMRTLWAQPWNPPGPIGTLPSD